MGKAEGLEPAVEHEVREAEIGNRVEAHNDEGCLPEEVQESRHGAEPLFGDFACENDEIRCRNRGGDAQKSVREETDDDIDRDPNVDGRYPEQNQGDNQSERRFLVKDSMLSREESKVHEK